MDTWSKWGPKKLFKTTQKSWVEGFQNPGPPTSPSRSGDKCVTWSYLTSKQDSWLFAKCPQVLGGKGITSMYHVKLISPGEAPWGWHFSQSSPSSSPDSRWLCRASFSCGAEITAAMRPCISSSEQRTEHNGTLLSTHRELGCRLNIYLIPAPLTKASFNSNYSWLTWARKMMWEESLLTSRSDGDKGKSHVSWVSTMCQAYVLALNIHHPLQSKTAAAFYTWGGLAEMNKGAPGHMVVSGRLPTSTQLCLKKPLLSAFSIPSQASRWNKAGVKS